MRYLYTLLFLSLITWKATAQENSNAADLEQLRAPAAPAATIISIQPNEVVKPKSAKELEAALFSNYLGDDNSLTIPDNMMIEGMPYWMGDRKNVDIVNDYLNEDIDNLMWKTLAVSVASTQNFKISDSVNTNALGFGFRTMLRRGDLFKDGEKLVNAIRLRDLFAHLLTGVGLMAQTMDTNGLTTRAQYYAKLKNQYQITPSYDGLSANDKVLTMQYFDSLQNVDDDFDPATEADIVDNYFTDRADNYRDIVKELYKAFKNERTGLQIEMAGAMALNFPTNETDFSTVPKFGIWFTGTFNPAKEKNGKKVTSFRRYTSVVLLARYIRNDADYYQKYFPDSAGYYQDNFDIGFRLMYEKNRFSVGAEVVGRWRNTLLEQIQNADGSVTTTKKSDTDFKYVFNFNYSVSDDLVLTYSFGKQLEPALKVNGTLISQLGVNLGFGGPKKE